MARGAAGSHSRRDVKWIPEASRVEFHRSFLQRGKVKERNMNKRIGLLVGVSALAVAGVVGGQEVILNMVANKVIAKYQNASCEQLWQQKGQPKSPEEQKAVNFLRNDPQARTDFLNKIAPPIVNKMFECGMIP
jgi:hypothetical protein